MPPWIQLCFLLILSKLTFFQLPILLPLVFYLIHAVSIEGSLNCISRIQFRWSFVWPWVNQYMVCGFDLLTLDNFLLCFVRFQQKTFLILLLTRFRCSFFWLWVNQFLFILSAYDACLPLIQAQSDSSCLLKVMIWKLEFCVISLWFYYHRFWWSSWHAMLALFLF